MGNNYDIHFNPKEPSGEDIEKHQDFDALLLQYKKAQTPRRLARRRQLYVWSTAVAAAIAGVIFFFGVENKINKTVTETAYFQAQAFVHPPIETIQPTFASFTVNANQGGVYEYESGSRLVVPAEAFMDDYGKLIEGEVAIRYREMHDYVDFFLAGIPMVYDSAGVRYNLESAGMVEIYAEKDGQRVQMAPGKTIDVELVALINVPDINMPPNYNIYKLDTAARQWAYQDIDRIQFLEDQVLDAEDPLFYEKHAYLEELEKIDQQAAAELGALEASIPKPIAPSVPHAYNDDYPTLELDFLESVLENGQEELLTIQEQYGDIIWQIAPSSPEYDERAFQVVWQSATLLPLEGQAYELTLIHEDTQLPLHVLPVLMGEEYDQAIATYQDDFNAYETALANWKDQVADQQRQIEQLKKQRLADAKTAFMNTVAELSADDGPAADASIRRKVVNRFKANSFGIWNCDRPVTPDYQKVQGAFVDEQGNTITMKTGYLVDKKKNTLFRFLVKDGVTIPFDANSENLLWIVLEDHQIALFRPERFKQINQKKGSHTFELTRIDRKLEREQDIRQILEF